jgi:hypothetical protein
MSEITIRTNGQYRPVLCWEDLTVKEQGEYDIETFYNSSFFRYRGWVYTLEDFMCIGKDSGFGDGWDGYHNDSFFSGVLVKYSRCGDAVKVATYFS